MGLPLDPWHMWGSQENLLLPVFAGPTNPATRVTQLARVNYKRPENWRFFLFAKSDDIGAAEIIGVEFHVIAGVGRTSVEFILDRINLIGGLYPPGVVVWRTTSRQPDFAVTPDRLPTDHFPAQDIQAWAVVSWQGAVAESHVQFGCWFSPNVHVRPDWYQEDQAAQFAGSEISGS